MDPDILYGSRNGQESSCYATVFGSLCLALTLQHGFSLQRCPKKKKKGAEECGTLKIHFVLGIYHLMFSILFNYTFE